MSDAPTTNEDKAVERVTLAPDIDGPCPNCKENYEAIPRMADGSCGVCAGTGVITWKDTGYRVGKYPSL